MATPYIGQIIAAAFNFAPVGWAFCNGQIVSIAEYNTLFQLIGTTYGGDGVNTFGLPNLNGRVPVGQGTGLGLSTYVLGQNAGATSVTLTSAQNGSHTHALKGSANNGSVAIPASNVSLGVNTATQVETYGTVAPNTPLRGNSIGVAGQSLPHENQQPYLAINYIIALFGVFPSQ